VLRFRSLGSGSTGNATLVEAGSGQRVSRLLVDCGLGVRQLDQRLARCGLTTADIDAIFITHEHSDHIGCARSIVLRQRVPIWMSPGTFAGMGAPDFEGLLREAGDGTRIEIGEMFLLPFTVPHDAREPLQLRCSDGNRHLGILTDLGHASAHVLQNLAACHALLLEFNHDPDLLAGSAYHPALKKRVGGKFGHLSNQDAAEIVRAVNHQELALVVAAHLSRQNNRPDLVRSALAQVLPDRDPEGIPVADPLQGTDWIPV
jgi:phosphoribosyl 1,2-cyclic phosphodiesterase